MVVIPTDRARSRICSGMAQMAAVLARTLGPDTGTVINAETGREPELLDSSGIVARRIVELPDRCANIGAMLVRHGVWRMHDRVGDGGAITAALTHSLISGGSRAMSGGADGEAVRRGLRRGLAAASADLAAQSRPADPHRDLPLVLRTAFGDGDLSARLAGLCAELGTDGYVEMRNAAGTTSTHRMIPGGRWPGRIITPELPGRELLLTDPYILVTDRTIDAAAEIAPLLDALLAEDGGPLLVVAKDVTGAARRLLGANRERIQVATVRLAADSQWRQQLEDIAVATRARFISEQFGDSVAAAGIDDLGYAQHARLRREVIELLGGAGDPDARATRIRALRATETDDSNQRDDLQRRIGNLAGRNAVLSLGATTPIERARARETAERAVRLAAVCCEHGVVAGAGAALVRSRPEVESLTCSDADERLGLRLFATALGVPLRQITGRSYDPGAVPGLINDLCRRGVLDSTAMLTQALETAVSTAATALTSAAVVLPRTRRISLTP